MLFESHGGNILNIAQNDDFCHIAMQLFRVAGHTFNVKALIPNKKIQDFVYIHIQHNQVLTPTDWNYLNRVISASFLFSNGANYFDISNCDAEIDYYAISIKATNNERSPLAHKIHKIVSRISMAALSVVLFEVNGFFMLSFAKRKQGQQSTVILSDWFSLTTIETEILFRINAAYFTSASALDFFFDFAYMVARPYYRYPISFEYAKYEMFPIKVFVEKDIDVIDRETINKIIHDNYFIPLHIYKDDYVTEEDYQRETQFLSTEDIDLELIELKMETIEPDNKEYDLLDGNSIEGDEFVCEEEDNYLDELEEELFDDPIKMLNWIKGKYVFNDV